MVSGTALVLAVTASVVGVPLGMLLTGAIFSAMFEFLGVIVDPSGSFGPITLLLVFGHVVRSPSRPLFRTSASRWRQGSRSGR
jgi:hypothetical protein